MAMTHSKLRSHLVSFALGLPGSFEDHPWGETVAKVGKKVFVFFGTSESQAEGFGFCAKLPDSGVVALSLPFVKPAGYGLGKSGWVYVRFPPKTDLPVEMLESWIVESYSAVAPKKLVAALRDANASAPARSLAKKPAAKKPAAKKPVAKKPAAKKAVAKKPAAKRVSGGKTG